MPTPEELQAEAYAILDQYLGAGQWSDPGNIQSVLSGRASLDEFAYDTMLRGLPTASGGGTGGDADVDGDGRIDPGWVPNAGGQAWVWGGNGSAPSASNNGPAGSTPDWAKQSGARNQISQLFDQAMSQHRQPENNPWAWQPDRDTTSPNRAATIAPASPSLAELYATLNRLGVSPSGPTGGGGAPTTGGGGSAASGTTPIAPTGGGQAPAGDAGVIAEIQKISQSGMGSYEKEAALAKLGVSAVPYPDGRLLYVRNGEVVWVERWK